MKLIATILLTAFILMPGSAFHDLLLIMLLLYMWRNAVRSWLNSHFRYGYKALWLTLSCLALLSMPRPFALPRERVQLVHFNECGELTNAPLLHWVANIVFPEETLCAAGCLLPLTPLRYAVPAGESILKDYYIELRSGGLLKIGKAYRQNSLALSSPMSGAITQTFSYFSGRSIRSAYIIRPRHYDPNKEYPVLFFAHGFLGNWKMYTGLLRNIENHIVVCMGTEDLMGFFAKRHIDEIWSVYLPLLADMGLRADPNAVSLMGLSNGGTAVDAAYSTADDYKNLIYVSTGVNRTHKTSAKVMVIGGGRDHCAPSMKSGMAKLVSNGVNTAFCFDENHTHLKLISDIDNCIDFLNNEL